MSELDPETSALIAMLGADPTRPKLHELSPVEARQGYRRMTASFAGPPAALEAVEDRVIAGPAGPIPVRIYRPEADSESSLLPGIVFFHGGGWVIGDLETHDVPARALALRTGAVVIAVDYRLAPEHKFPAAVEDAEAATRWAASAAASLGIDARRLAVAGDSAGGNLAAVAARLARDAGVALAQQLLVYPVAGGATDTESYRENGRGYMLERETMEWFIAHYARSDADLSDPRLAPLLAADLSGLAPAIIVTAGFDPLRDDGRLYAAALRRAGVPVRLLEYDTLVHGFLAQEGVSAAARDACAEIAATLAAGLAAGLWAIPGAGSERP